MGKMIIGSIQQLSKSDSTSIESALTKYKSQKPIESKQIVEKPSFVVQNVDYVVEKPQYVEHVVTHIVKKPHYHEQVIEHIVKVPVVKEEIQEITVTKYSLKSGKDWILPGIMTVSAIAHIAALIWR